MGVVTEYSPHSTVLVQTLILSRWFPMSSCWSPMRTNLPWGSQETPRQCSHHLAVSLDRVLMIPPFYQDFEWHPHDKVLTMCGPSPTCVPPSTEGSSRTPISLGYRWGHAACKFSPQLLSSQLTSHELTTLNSIREEKLVSGSAPMALQLQHVKLPSQVAFILQCFSRSLWLA